MPSSSPQQINRRRLVFHQQQHRKRHGYFTSITNNYSGKSADLLKSWLNVIFSIAIVKNLLKFHTECRKFVLIPKHISTLKISHLFFRSNYVKKKYGNYISITQKQFLKWEIKDAHFHLAFY